MVIVLPKQAVAAGYQLARIDHALFSSCAWQSLVLRSDNNLDDFISTACGFVNYGHGGAGIALSCGCPADVVAVVDQILVTGLVKIAIDPF